MKYSNEHVKYQRTDMSFICILNFLKGKEKKTQDTLKVFSFINVFTLGGLGILVAFPDLALVVGDGGVVGVFFETLVGVAATGLGKTFWNFGPFLLVSNSG